MSDQLRAYQIEGEVPEVTWNSLLNTINGLGIKAVQTEVTGLLEPEPITEEVLNAPDFHRFASEHGFSKVTATMSWLSLARLYDKKVNARYWNDTAYYWYNAANYDYVTLSYLRNGDPVTDSVDHEYYVERLGDLTLNSLRSFMVNVNRGVIEHGSRNIRLLLGSGNGTRVLHFLNLISGVQDMSES